MHHLGSRSRTAIAVAGSTFLGLGLTAMALPSQAVTPSAATASHSVRHAEGDRTRAAARTPGYVDARVLAPRAVARAEARRLASRTPSARSFEQSLGGQSLVDFDPLTGTPRQLGRLDGYLTARSSRPARTVALDYVRAHAADLGLSSSDLATFRFRDDYVDSIGVHHLSWTQSVDGTSVFGNGLKVSVTRDGRVLDVQGSPVHGLAQLAAAAPQGTRLDAAAARSAAARDVGGHAARATVTSSRSGASASTRWSNHDYSTKVWFLTPSGLRPGWSTYVTSDAGAYQHVVDAVTGSVLLRRTTTDNDRGEGKVYRYYPGSATGGTAVNVNFFKQGWLPRNAYFLKGTNITAFADLNDDNAINPNEKTPVPGTKHSAQFKLKPFSPTDTQLCSKKIVCTWDPEKPYSWRTNRNADVTNAFYLANTFHDWLEDGPAKFTAKAGNFSAAGGDPVLLNALDGADTADGLPDSNHIDNANMNTPPDGTPPTMQMYLWHAPGTTDDQDPFAPTSGAFDPSILYHEFTHGLSNRLVVDAQGNSTLNALQAGSMGEAWSDYYAMDFLAREGLVKDTAKDGEVVEGTYVAGGGPFRTEPIDCPVGSAAAACGTALDGKPGGYTYGDVPTIGGAPEVHASGEVWAQTLWDIRKALGSTRADTLITRAMSLSADDPSMLDMRNAILQADLVGFSGADTATLWKLFAVRGMGYFAGSDDSSDANPAENFRVPPQPETPRTSISGVVTDPTTGDPVQGAVVTITGFGTRYTAVTNASGVYTIGNVFPGTYAKVTATAPGYLPDSEPVSTSSDSADFAILHDWAAASGGGTVEDFNGPDYSDFGCGPIGAIDSSLGTGWGSTTGDDDGDPTGTFVPKHIVVKLAGTVDVSTFGVDPKSTCGDAGSASTGDYTIETSPDGVTYTQAAAGTFTAADRGTLNAVTPTAGTTGVRYVRFTILSNQVPDFATNCPDGAFDGCSFTDLSELAVFGTASPTA